MCGSDQTYEEYLDQIRAEDARWQREYDAEVEAERQAEAERVEAEARLAEAERTIAEAQLARSLRIELVDAR
jgi:hypothetical protein